MFKTSGCTEKISENLSLWKKCNFSGSRAYIKQIKHFKNFSIQEKTFLFKSQNKINLLLLKYWFNQLYNVNSYSKLLTFTLQIF